MASLHIIAVYEEVSALTGEMLAAARQSDWERLSLLENQCSAHVQMLRSGETRMPLTGSARDSKVELIRKILEDDRQIRALTEPWMAQLQTLINSNDAERRLGEAYGLDRTG